MVKAQDIARAIEEFAPLATQVDWDNSGFTCGDPSKQVHKALIALNCTQAVMEEAVDKGCDLLLTHHPLIVHAPCLNIMHADVRGRMIETAIRGGLTVYSSHTPLDKAEGGLNTLMARMLGLQDCRMLVEGGFGAIGSLAGPTDAMEFIAFVKRVFNAPDVRTSRPIKEKILRVAVSSGGGQGSIRDAVEQGAQVLVTGDVTHHNFYTPDNFMVIDVGHHYSEWPAAALLESIVKKNFPTFATLISERDLSPIYYF